MDGVESSGKEHGIKQKSKKKRKARPGAESMVLLTGAHGIKQKSKNKRKARPDAGDDACAICDDGGYITCCDGGCLRSFHLTIEHGEASNCRTVGLTTEQAKVFQCKDANCGHFYHPKCVADLLHPGSKVWASLFEQRVAAGLKFLCPVHNCRACHRKENKDDVNMQFAVCRRCPTTYHRKCLPSDIPFKTENGSIQRAWDGILRDQILMYCTKHVEIVEELGIPMTRRIIFPDARDLCVAEGPESAPKEQDVEDEELLDHPSSVSSPSTSPPADIQDRFLCSNPDSFVPKSLCMHPYPGTGGWLDDSD